MAKKTENKELKVKAPSKKEAVKIPNTPLVKIVFNGKEYEKSYQVAKVLIENGKAKLA
jgi:hypothetical protein